MKRILLSVLIACACWAEDLSFTCATDKPAIAYQPGEAMVFSVQLLEGGKPVAGRRLAWTRRGDDGKTASGEAVSAADAPLTISTASAAPGFVHIVVSVRGDDGKPVQDAKGGEVKLECGAGVHPELLSGVTEPADFDAFWARQRAKLAGVPSKAVLTPVESRNPDFELFDVTVDCPGGRPVAGYLTRPKGAAAKSLPVQVGFMGYGVNSASMDFRPGIVSLTINAHGIANGQDEAYYNALRNGELKGYAFNQQQNADPETAYFNSMMLRVLRALEFAKSLPEWNGKDLIASGGSQGGFQALAAAGLDYDVTRCLAYKPWCCDLGGVTMQRVGGWRPAWNAALAYYDPINHARRIRCDTYISSGLGDYVCPPSGLSVLFNNLAGPKKIEFVQGMTHGFEPRGAARTALTGK
jgi:cephalosporin-C deacetylase